MMRRCWRGLTPIANVLAYRLAGWLGRVRARRLGRRGADYSIEPANLYRMEAHWALTFTRLGTVHFPPARLRHLATCLDFRSYLRVLGQARFAVGAGTIRVVEGAETCTLGGRSIRVADDYYGPGAPPDALFYPYAMHPWVYALGEHRRVRRLREGRRPCRLFFAGVVNEGYADRFDFPMMDRPAVIEYVRDTFRTDACIVTSRADLPALRRTDRPIRLILFRGAITPAASNHYLPRQTYLRMLARSAFALCPPGVFMPHSHNLVEAMAVGTVPLLNYPTFCRPELTPGTTCLAFATPDDLGTAVRHALNAPDDEIRPIRAAVGRFYDTELSPAGSAQRLARWLAEPGPRDRLILNREFPAARAWSARQVRVP